MSARNPRVVPLPRTTEEIKASRAAPLPPGVTMARSSGYVVGLHVAPDGVGILEHPDWPWRPLGRVSRVRRGLLRSRVRIRFADGSRLRARPFAPGQRGLVEAGAPESSLGVVGGRPGSEADDIVVFIVVIASIVLFVPAIYLLVRELSGISPRARTAAVLVGQLRAQAAG